jgi:hypothetical protein
LPEIVVTLKAQGRGRGGRRTMPPFDGRHLIVEGITNEIRIVERKGVTEHIVTST